ncbi:hypothetical protein DPSP01_006127 [Paraphaeosphaeria sporulosa]|uniref:Caspase family p20 domain-containing protein n=1 Tax=Paraphaeosphaeria sporulosa TaxID=1460663 RepID=A0A177BWB8_9PLEO|nr:uncharacterized protein CC84DRAFT_1233988 [Paraphaeosphaeria sporulosa]OAF98807.1 hypothetical protein CC84DRAFT_1233988 [Paraphaeosphaeria sporulosa]
MSLHLDTSGLIQHDVALEMSPEEIKTPRFRQFQENFEKHMPSARKPKEYDHVGVLLLSFDPTSELGGMGNMDVSEEIESLRDVFLEYEFDVTSKVIPCDETANAYASSCLYAFELEHAKKEHHLSIIYYAGHGWRNRDHNPARAAYAMDLMPEAAQRDDTKLPEGTYIMWDRAEHILQEFKHDHLVIFDCCDGGFLSTRGSRHAFEYLVACEGRKRTHKPGPHSFTTALIWALKELKPVAPFTMLELRDQIKRYKDFPTKQRPLVFARPDHVAGPISMAPIDKSTNKGIGPSSKATSHVGPVERSFVDLRFFFTKDITAEDAKQVAEMVKSAVQGRSFKFNATHVSVLDQGRTANLMKIRDHWRRARDSLGFLSRSRKRMRTGQSETPSRKSSRLEAGDVLGRPVTPISDDPRSDVEAQVVLPPVRIETGAATTLDVRVPLVINHDSSLTQES